MASADALSAEIASLRDLDLPALRRRWRVLVGKKAPEHLSRSLLVRVLAYRIQARALGDLDRETVRLLDRLAKDKNAQVALPEQRSIKPGTLLVREWEGTLQHVMVLEQGFACNGATYSSLSQVARAITGTNWNGPRFFGLRDRKRVGAVP